MATTSRRKKKEIITEVENLGIETKGFSTHIQADHLLALETKSRDVENKRLLMHVEEQSLRNLMLERQLLDAKIEKVKIHLNEVASSYYRETEGFKKFKAALWPQYGLNSDEGLGYNPLSGEIVKTDAKNSKEG